MKFRFVIPGCPVPWQRIRTKQGQFFTAEKTRKYQRFVQMCARTAGIQKLTGQVLWSIWIYLPDARRRDRDNIEKSIQDALNEIAYDDDSQIREWHGGIYLDRENPRVVLQLETLEAKQ